MMPTIPQPVGRPPKPIQPRTPITAAGQASAALSPISTKVAKLKEAGVLAGAGIHKLLNKKSKKAGVGGEGGEGGEGFVDDQGYA